MKIDKYYCDRCGMEIKNYGSRREYQGFLEVVKNCSKGGAGLWSLDKIDLCDECRDSFYDWWEIHD